MSHPCLEIYKVADLSGTSAASHTHTCKIVSVQVGNLNQEKRDRRFLKVRLITSELSGTPFLAAAASSNFKALGSERTYSL